MPICRTCKIVFEGVYRKKYCSTKCQFLSKVPERLEFNECWNWSGGKSTAGYGAFHTQEKIELAHRFSYQLFKGPVDKGMFVCHSCDNPSCINPSHLFSGTVFDNAADMARKGRAAWRNKSRPPETIAKISAKRRSSGWKPSREQIEASIAARAKKMADPEWREAVYSKIRGKNHPNYGKPWTEEQHAKNKKHLETHGGSMKGKKHSEETKQKMRMAALARMQRAG